VPAEQASGNKVGQKSRRAIFRARDKYFNVPAKTRRDNRRVPASEQLQGSKISAMNPSIVLRNATRAAVRRPLAQSVRIAVPALRVAGRRWASTEGAATTAAEIEPTKKVTKLTADS
jgi:hypothetical protein